jgi:hypothetical protein
MRVRAICWPSRSRAVFSWTQNGTEAKNWLSRAFPVGLYRVRSQSARRLARSTRSKSTARPLGWRGTWRRLNAQGVRLRSASRNLTISAGMGASKLSRSPAVESLLGDAHLATDLRHVGAAGRLLHSKGNLLFGKVGFAHLSPPGWEKYVAPGFPSFPRSSFAGQDHLCLSRSRLWTRQGALTRR